MSNKITGKNLHYDQTLPPFLARLKGQQNSSADEPDPILASRRRAAKKRSASEEADDAPVIVDDAGNVLRGVEVGVDGTVKDSRDQQEEQGATTENKDQPVQAAENGDKEVDKTAAIGGSRKRKMGKVIGADAEEPADAETRDQGAKKESTKTTTTTTTTTANSSKDPSKSKKKSKKIKLSFGDDDGN